MNRTTTNRRATPLTPYQMGIRSQRSGVGNYQQASGIGVPSYRRIGVTIPSHKRYNHKESGLQSPPTRDTPIPTRDTPIQVSVTPLTPLIREEFRDLASGDGASGFNGEPAARAYYFVSYQGGIRSQGNKM